MGGAEKPVVAILGAGFGGLCMAMQLKQAGIPFVVLEKADRIGGTWRENTYPGSGCDVPSHLYSYSFAPKPDWSRLFPEQEEILGYLEDCVDAFELRPHIHLNTEVESARFDEERGEWNVFTSDGETFTARVLVSGLGQLNRPHTPDLPGLGEFEGPRFHSAEWRHDIPLAGKRVGVVGTGASAVQFVPRIAEKVQHLVLFQRSPNWMIPKPDREYWTIEKWLFEHVPAWRKLHRFSIYWRLEARFGAFHQNSWLNRYVERVATQELHDRVKDWGLRQKLTPDFPVGCKRILISNDYLTALTRRNVSVETSAIERVTASGIRCADGVVHDLDALVFATGFQTTSFLSPVRIRGRDGRELHDAWSERGGAEAYLGMTVPGFPNFFMLYGPNTNLGHNSIVFMIECQTKYTVQCVQQLLSRHLRFLDVKPEVHRAYNEQLQEDLADRVWGAGCSSWYKNDSGKITNNWSGYTAQYWWRTRIPDMHAFDQCSKTRASALGSRSSAAPAPRPAPKES